MKKGARPAEGRSVLDKENSLDLGMKAWSMTIPMSSRIMEYVNFFVVALLYTGLSYRELTR